ncbi:MAG TPA: S1C family serine protease [Bryobacteraceae bacterium]|jgi:S1-C subfamily serine protease
MSEASEFDLQAYSAAVAQVVEKAGTFVAAVKAAAYRVASGVIFREDLIAVNNHVLRREGTVPVHLPDGTEAQASILGRDPSVDLAILKVTGAKWQPALAEEESAQRAGALAIVVGRTIDSGLSASVGTLGAVGGPRPTWRGGQLSRFLRLDVNVYPSQAGAAVVSARGRFLGMASAAMLRHSTLAVPPETLDRIANELLSEGRIRKGYLGVALQPVAIPEHLRSKSSLAGTSGLMVLSVEPGASAEDAGIQMGDILLAAGSTSLTEPETLLSLLGGDVLGKPLRLTVLRAGSIVDIEIQVAVRESKRN